MREELEVLLQPSPAPSLPTLKSWSRAGRLPQGLALAQAAEHLVERIRAGELRVKGPRKPARAEARPAPGDDVAALLPLLQEFAQALRQRPVATSAAPAQEGMAPELQRAIEQLDATRRHILLQHDAQRQPAPSNPVPSGGLATGVDFLEWQRLMARVARIEDTLSRVLERLESGNGN